MILRSGFDRSAILHRGFCSSLSSWSALIVLRSLRFVDIGVFLRCHCVVDKPARWLATSVVPILVPDSPLSVQARSRGRSWLAQKNTIDTASIAPTITYEDNTMKAVSSKTRWQVKHKPANISALPDSVNLQLEIPGAEPAVKDQQAQDLQKSDPGARDGFALEKDIGILSAGATSKHTSLAARYILGVIMAFLGKAYSKYLLEEWFAQAARRSRWSVIRLTKQLEEAGLLDVERKGKCNRYHVPEWVKREDKVWVSPALVRDEGLSIVDACNLSE